MKDLRKATSAARRVETNDDFQMGSRPSEGDTLKKNGRVYMAMLVDDDGKEYGIANSDGTKVSKLRIPSWTEAPAGELQGYLGCGVKDLKAIAAAAKVKLTIKGSDKTYSLAKQILITKAPTWNEETRRYDGAWEAEAIG